MRLFLFAIALLAAAPAFAQSPRRDIYVDVIATALRFESEGVRIAETASRGDAIISMPVRHLRTGVAREPIRFRGGMRNGAPYIEAGAHGYFAGEFADSANASGMPAWCFSNRPDNADAAILCIIQSSDSETGWRVAREPTNKYRPVSFALTPLGTPVEAPTIEERLVSVHPDLRVEYVLRGVSRRSVDVELRLGGSHPLTRGVFQRLTREPDGAALLGTPHGVLRLAPDGATVRVSRVEGEAAP